jgi:hypothetical protein
VPYGNEMMIPGVVDSKKKFAIVIAQFFVRVNEEMQSHHVHAMLPAKCIE